MSSYSSPGPGQPPRLNLQGGYASIRQGQNPTYTSYQYATNVSLPQQWRGAAFPAANTQGWATFNNQRINNAWPTVLQQETWPPIIAGLNK